MDVDEYLRFERASMKRHEFVNGQVFAMTGASSRHNIIVLNIASCLRQHVRGSKCRTYAIDQKLRTATDDFYYPDVIVACEHFDKNSEYSERAVLIVEVLSKSTSSIDRREKVFAYRQIPTLMEYLIVLQNRKKVQLHRREKEEWVVLEFGPGDNIDLLSELHPMRISMDQIYEEIDWNRGNSWEVKDELAGYKINRTGAGQIDCKLDDDDDDDDINIDR